MYMCFNFKKFVVVILSIVLGILSCSLGFNLIYSRADDEKGIFLPVIMYHSIIDDASQVSDYIVTPKIVEDDFKYLKSHGYESVTVKDLVDYIENDTPLPKKPVLITADDGFYNNYCYLVPLLQKYGYRAIISFVGEYTDVTAVNDPHVPEYSYCTWEDINEMLATDTIELGNHTYSMHDNSNRKGCAKLSYETDDDYKQVLTADVGKLQQEFHNNIGKTPKVFAYPFGYISKESVPILKKLGFKATLNCYEKPNYITKDLDCLFGLNRYNRSASYSTDEYMKKLLGDFYES
ncbi:MAG: polysaccharide deacetylase family protein [Oscillospiraceae bacterium]